MNSETNVIVFAKSTDKHVQFPSKRPSLVESIYGFLNSNPKTSYKKTINHFDLSLYKMILRNMKHVIKMLGPCSHSMYKILS